MLQSGFLGLGLGKHFHIQGFKYFQQAFHSITKKKKLWWLCQRFFASCHKERHFSSPTRELCGVSAAISQLRHSSFSLTASLLSVLAATLAAPTNAYQYLTTLRLQVQLVFCFYEGSLQRRWRALFTASRWMWRHALGTPPTTTSKMSECSSFFFSFSLSFLFGLGVFELKKIPHI